MSTVNQVQDSLGNLYDIEDTTARAGIEAINTNFTSKVNALITADTTHVKSTEFTSKVNSLITADTTHVKTTELTTKINDYLDKQNIPTDIAQAKEDIIKNAHESAGAIVCNASGSVVSVNDASDRELHHITLYGKSTQDGIPSIETPIDIVSVGDDGNVAINVYGKNLIDYINSKWKINVNSCTFNIENGVITVNTTEATTSGIYVKLPHLQKRTLSFEAYADISGAKLSAGFGGRQSFVLSTSWQKFSGVFSAIANASALQFYGADSFGCTIYIRNVQVECGEIATAYEPFVGVQSASIDLSEPLRGLPVTSDGNYTDADGQQWIADTLEVFADGTGKITQKIGKYVIDGSGYIGDMSAYAGVKNNVSNFRADIYGFKKTANLVSTQLQTTAVWGADQEGISFTTADNKVDFTLNYARLGITSEAIPAERVLACIAYLTENPITFLAETTTPIVTELTAEQVQAFVALHSYKPNTTITTDDMGDIAVEYIADSKTYIDNKFTELSNAIVALAE